MALIEWVPDLSVGVKSLDTDHKLLISFINELDSALRGGEVGDTVCRILDGLLDYTTYHFAREEALMAACRYPDLEAHRLTHHGLRQQVASIRDNYRMDPETIHAREVLAFLKNWLTSHIVSRDKMYQPFMESALDAVDVADQELLRMGRAE